MQKNIQETAGENYMDLKNDLLYVIIKGTDPIDIRTFPAVIVKFGFPAVSIDEFFEENLINNLAKLVLNLSFV